MFSGPRRGPDSSGAGNIVIELLDDGISAETHDVDFGGRSMRPPRPDSASQNRARKILAVIAGAAMLVGAAVWLTQRGGTSADETEATTSVASAADPTTPRSSPADSATPTGGAVDAPLVPVVVNGGQPIAEITDDISVYLVDENNFTDVYRLHLATGVADPIGVTTADLGPVVGIAGTPTDPVVVRAPSSDGAWSMFRPGPDGTYWQQLNDTLQLVQPGVEDVVRQIVPPWGSDGQFGGAYLVGTSQSREPVIGGPDGRFYEIQPIGGATVFSETWPENLVAGNYTTVTCAVDGDCVRRIQTTAGSFDRPFDVDEFHSALFVSPDGKWAIEETTDAAERPRQWFIDVLAGDRRQIDLGSSSESIGFVDESINSTGAQQFRSLWSSDSRFFVTRRRASSPDSQERLAVFSVSTGALALIDLPIELGPVVPIAVM